MESNHRPTAEEAPIVLEARGISKQFPGVLANDRIDLTLRKGEILAMLGENGAGKSTLMNILYGFYHPDEGEVWIKGERAPLQNPGDAIARGVGMVHQHFQLVPVMTVAENVILGAEVTRGAGYIDIREANNRVRELSQQYGLAIDSLEEAFHVLQASDPQEYAKRCEVLCRKSLEAMRDAGEAQMEETQDALNKWVALMARAAN